MGVYELVLGFVNGGVVCGGFVRGFWILVRLCGVMGICRCGVVVVFVRVFFVM